MAMIADFGLIAMVADDRLLPMFPLLGFGACRRNNVGQRDHDKNGEDEAVTE